VNPGPPADDHGRPLPPHPHGQGTPPPHPDDDRTPAPGPIGDRTSMARPDDRDPTPPRRPDRHGGTGAPRPADPRTDGGADPSTTPARGRPRTDPRLSAPPAPSSGVGPRPDAEAAVRAELAGLADPPVPPEYRARWAAALAAEPTQHPTDREPLPPHSTGPSPLPWRTTNPIGPEPLSSHPAEPEPLSPHPAEPSPLPWHTAASTPAGPEPPSSHPTGPERLSPGPTGPISRPTPAASPPHTPGPIGQESLPLRPVGPESLASGAAGERRGSGSGGGRRGAGAGPRGAARRRVRPAVVVGALLGVLVVGGVLGTRGTSEPEAAGVELAAAGRAALGSTDAGPLADPQQRAGCLRAAGVDGIDPGADLLGGRPVDVGGSAGVVLVLATGRLGEFRIVAVDRDCGPGAGTLLGDTTVGSR
jgi:hypothetical protein